MDEKRPVRLRIAKHRPEASADRGGKRALDLDGPRPVARQLQEKVALRTGRRAVEAGPGALGRRPEQGLDRETFPARSRDGMAEHALGVVEPQQGVDDPAVAHADLGRLHQPFADVGVKRRQPADEEGIGDS